MWRERILCNNESRLSFSSARRVSVVADRRVIIFLAIISTGMLGEVYTSINQYMYATVCIKCIDRNNAQAPYSTIWIEDAYTNLINRK